MKNLLFSVYREQGKFILEAKGSQPLSHIEMVCLASALVQLSASLLETGLPPDSAATFGIDSILEQKPS